MEIGLLQALLLGILAFLAGLDLFNGLTHFHRPVVLGPLVGLILGDLQTGILVGGTLETDLDGLGAFSGCSATKRDHRYDCGHHFCHHHQSGTERGGWRGGTVRRCGANGHHVALLCDVGRDVEV